MLAVILNSAGNAIGRGPLRVELVELPRPVVRRPADAVLMVTTSVIGPWEIELAARGGGPNGGGETTPGAQFAGIVVEVGEAVTAVDIDDLVVATCTASGPVGASGPGPGNATLFGTGQLHGGHAEYVLAPDADLVLVRTTPAAEERTVFAGGGAALGFAAADQALEIAGDGPVLVFGCDAAGLCALAWLKHRRGRLENVYAFDPHPARLAAAKTYGAQAVGEGDIGRTVYPDAVIAGSTRIGAAAETYRGVARMRLVLTNPEIDANHLLTPDPEGVSGEPPAIVVAAAWPTLEQTRRAEMAIRLRQVDLTPLVSTVVPLDEAAEGYRVAIESPPGARAVLLKP